MFTNRKLFSIEPKQIFAVGAGILLIVFLGVSLLSAYYGPVEFDEGFNLQIPSSLVRNGTYSTTYGGGKVFDPVISTGPTVLLPIAGIFTLFEIGIAQARTIMLIYFILFILLIFVFTYQRFGIVSTFFVLICLLLLPDIFYFGLKVLGEVPSLLFLLIGVICLEEDKALVSGIFFGLAILTKIILAIVVIPLSILFLYETIIGRKLKSSLQSLSILVLGISIPNLLLEVTKIYNLGMMGYKEHILGILLLSKGAAQLPRSLYSIFTLDQYKMFSMPFPGIPIWIGISLILTVLCYHLIIICNQKLSYFNIAAQRTRLFIVLFVFFYFIWWILGSETGWWRHLFPGYLMFMLLVGISLGDMTTILIPTRSVSQNKERWQYWLKKIAFIIVTCLAGVIFLIIPMKSQARKIWQSTNPDLLNIQISLARNVKTIIQNGGHFGYWGWWQSPEISFLAQKQFHNIEDKETRDRFDYFVRGGNPTYVIVGPAQLGLAPQTLQEEMIYLGDLANEVGSFQIYEYIPTFDTTAQNYYIVQRENIANIPTKFCPSEMSQNKQAKRYLYDGVYSDGWIGKKASLWLNNEKESDEIVITGAANFHYYSEDRLSIRVNLNDVPILETDLGGTGEFKVNTRIPKVVMQSPLIKVAIEASSSFVPREWGISNDDRELSIQIKCVELK